jgi:tetratricopeptide (TPR) repeat protein
MTSLRDRLAVLSPDELDEFDRWTAAYESAWPDGDEPGPPADRFLPDRDPPLRLVLASNVKFELESLSRRGTPLDPAEVLARYPRIAEDPESCVEVLAWGSRLADTHPGPSTDRFRLSELVELYPGWRDALVERRSADFLEQGGDLPPELVPEGMRLLQALPEGGMSRLFLVWNTFKGREEVLKLVHPGFRGNAEAVKRFEREIRVASALEGCRVVPVYQAGSVGGHLYYTMRYLRGGSLRDRLRSKAGVPLKDGVRVLAEVARAVHRLHTSELRVIHRDLKPENLLFEGDGLAEPWVADLGLARLQAETIARPGDAAVSVLTAPNVFYLGTPGYMAPEQVNDVGRRAGPAADVHALGAILYELLTGRRPFLATSGPATVQQTLNDDPLPPGRLAPDRDVPRDLETIALKALRKDPRDRFATAAELAEDLERWLRREPIRSRPPTALERARWFARRYKAATAAAAVSALAVATAAVVSFGFFLGEKRQRARADRAALRAVERLGAQATQMGEESGFAQQAGLTRFRSRMLRETAGALQAVVDENQGIGSVVLGSALNSLTLVHSLLGETAEALKTSRRAAAVFSTLPPTYEARAGLAAARLQTGRLLFVDGKPADGLASTEQAARLYRGLVAERPGDNQTRFRLALAELNLGNFAREAEPDRAVAKYHLAIDHLNVLRQADRDEPRYVEWTARALGNLGSLLTARGDAAGAIEVLTPGVDLSVRLAALRPDDKAVIDSLAAIRSNLGEALTAARRPGDALPVLQAALKDYQGLNARFPDEFEFRWGVPMIQTDIAEALGRLGRWGEALPWLEKAGPALSSLLEAQPDNGELKANVEKHRALTDEARKQAGSPSPKKV